MHAAPTMVASVSESCRIRMASAAPSNGWMKRIGAAAEVARQDSWQVAVLGVAYVSGEASHAEEVIQHAVRYIEDSRPDIAVTDVQVDVLPFGD